MAATYEFTCASPVCKTSFRADSKDAIMTDVAQHFAITHKVPRPSRSIVAFLQENTVRRLTPEMVK